MGIEDVVCPECKRHVSTLEVGPSGRCLCCEENELHDRFADERFAEEIEGQVDEGS